MTRCPIPPSVCCSLSLAAEQTVAVGHVKRERGLYNSSASLRGSEKWAEIRNRDRTTTRASAKVGTAIAENPRFRFMQSSTAGSGRGHLFEHLSQRHGVEWSPMPRPTAEVTYSRSRTRELGSRVDD